MISAAQCRAARALIDWSPARLAQVSGIPLDRLAAFERGGDLDPEALAQIVRVFEENGAVLVKESRGRGAGVRLKFGRQTAKRIDVWENEGGPVAEDDIR